MDSNYGSVSYYQYQRIDLSTDAIRLVRLFSGYREEPIQCELVETFLHKVDGLPYEALSYAWGKSSDEHTIFINDQKALVGENLHMALLALRQQYEDRLLWIDAICIDQGNRKEKGHQVGQMRQIYEHAQKVLIWLGPSNPEIDLLMNMAGMWDYRTRQGPGARHEQTWIDSWNSLTSNETGLYKEEVTTRRRNSLQEILNRPWFRRVWIIQEAASASRATILCGSKALSSQGFSLLPYLLGLELDSSTQAILDILPSYRRQKTWWGEKNNLETLLMKFSASEATDPRDKIYALLGIASDARASNTLRPDYEISLDRAIYNTISFLLFQEIHEPSSLPLPMHRNIDDLHQFLPRLREYIFEALQQKVDVVILRQMGGLGRYISKLQAWWKFFTSRAWKAA
ncbi:heterokaryon incompatibility protein-domain-containing protein [Copromyces sp. CBS 386.78]|nr:heterokaryon incompatibility protein-domain-containing protein [Copromyces sp. CBS 386.78]